MARRHFECETRRIARLVDMMMKKFMVLFCRYDPDNFHGYFRHEFTAPDMDAANELARRHIDRNMFHVNGAIEYQVYEIADQNWGRLWDVKEQTHR